MRKCGRTGFIVLCLMFVMVSGFSCEAEHNRLKEVADIWQHLNTFRDTITVDRAKNPDNLEKLTIAVDQDIDLLRKRLKSNTAQFLKVSVFSSICQKDMFLMVQ